MKDRFVKLLNNQIDKLEAEDFDLEAWKSSAVAVLSRVFGNSDPRIKQIEDLKIDYSSWMLRDSGPNYKPLSTCKKKGREILLTAIDEVLLFGSEANKEERLAKFLDKSQVKTLFSDTSEAKKLKLLKKLKKEDMQEIILILST